MNLACKTRVCCRLGQEEISTPTPKPRHEYIQHERIYAYARACRHSRQNSCSSGTMRADTCGILSPVSPAKLPQVGGSPLPQTRVGRYDQRGVVSQEYCRYHVSLTGAGAVFSCLYHKELSGCEAGRCKSSAGQLCLTLTKTLTSRVRPALAPVCHDGVRWLAGGPLGHCAHSGTLAEFGSQAQGTAAVHQRRVVPVHLRSQHLLPASTNRKCWKQTICWSGPRFPPVISRPPLCISAIAPLSTNGQRRLAEVLRIWLRRPDWRTSNRWPSITSPLRIALSRSPTQDASACSSPLLTCAQQCVGRALMQCVQNAPRTVWLRTVQIRHAGPDRGSLGTCCAALAQCCQTLGRASMRPASAALPLPRC